MFALFWDMNSGGGRKEKWALIYIECEDVEEAKRVFYNRFGHNPERVSCTCCGPDYSISVEDSLEEASAYHRGCSFDWTANAYKTETGKSVEEHEAKDSVLIIRARDIPQEERRGEVPEQGYRWID